MPSSDVSGFERGTGKALNGAVNSVTFRYKADETRAQQYGLIAEEVEDIYPELVVHGADGQVETVAYQMLPQSRGDTETTVVYLLM